MKRLLNTLYVTKPDAYLSKDGETVQVRVEGKTELQLPIHTLGGIVCFGHVMCSPQLMGFCAERGVLLSFLSENGRFLARVHGAVNGNVLLRREQYRRADDTEASGRIAAKIVAAKAANCRTVLLRGARDGSNEEIAERFRQAAKRLARQIEKCNAESDLEAIRGYEGDAARTYFQLFDGLIVANREGFRFEQRTRRPPRDNMNALLSFLYTLLRHDVEGALEGVGLDPSVGFLHRDRPGRPGLALDLMEELRPFLADRMALSLVNRQQVKPKGFRTTESGAVLMDDDTRKAVLVSYQKRKQEEIRHEFLDERIPVGLLPHAQALLFSRYLRGDLDAYPAFLWR